MHHETNTAVIPPRIRKAHERATTIDVERDYWESLIDEGEAAHFLGHSVCTLQGWRSRGGGPRYIRISGRGVRYRRRDCKEWADSRLRTNNSDPGTEAA